MNSEIELNICYQEENYEKCLRILQLLPIKKRNLSHYKIIEAACLVNLGIDVKRAHEMLNDVITANTGNAFAHYGKGLAFIAESKFSEAIECFEKSIELDKHGHVGNAKELRRKSVVQLERRRTIKERETEVTFNYKEQNYDECLQLIQSLPDQTRILSHYRIIEAACIVNLDLDVSRAHEILNNVLNVEAFNPYAYYGKGLAYIADGKTIEAIECFEKSIKFNKSGVMGNAKELQRQLIVKLERDSFGTNKSNQRSSSSECSNESCDNLQVCTICSKQFDKKINLLRHVNTHFETETMPKSLKTEGKFENSHKIESKISMKKTHKSFQSSKQSKKLKNHQNNSAYQCDKCQKKFETKRNLYVHLRSCLKSSKHNDTKKNKFYSLR